MNNLTNDIAYAFRMMRKSPGFYFLLILTLALSIGLNTAVFSVINTVLLKPLPYPEAERVVQISRALPDGENDWTSFFKISYWSRHAAQFDAIAMVSIMPAGMNMVGVAEPQYIRTLPVSASFFRVAGVHPYLGRTFTRSEDAPGAGNVVVLSHQLWTTRFGSDPAAVGRHIRLGGSGYEIVGVMPPDFEFIPKSDVWTPIAQAPDVKDKVNRYFAFGLLKPGVSIGAAETDLKRVVIEFSREYPKLSKPGETVHIYGLQDKMMADLRPALRVLSAAVLLVLLIACTNVASLLISRAIARQREIGVRTAIGANRHRIFGQLLTECLVIALASGVIGTLLAGTTLSFLARFASAQVPRIEKVQLDWRVMVFTLAISALTGILFGVLPAYHASRVDLNSALQEGSLRTTAGMGRKWAQSILIAAEISLTFVLLVGATLLITSFLHLLRVQPGFDPEHVTTLKMSLTGQQFNSTAQVKDFTRKVVTRVKSVGGVQAIASVTTLPTETGPDMPFDILGRSMPPDLDNDTQWRAVSPEYFDAMKIPLHRGRLLAETDDDSSKPVVLINETLAQRFWPNKSPLGEHIVLGKILGPMFADTPREIVGVVADTRDLGLDQPAPALTYIPVYQVSDTMTTLFNSGIPTSWVIRSSEDSARLQELVRSEVRSVDPNQPIAAVQPLSAILGDSTSKRRFSTLLLSIFSAVALLLTIVGIYGVTSTSVKQRRQEFGIRIALGATKQDVLRGVIWEGVRLAVLGVCVGIIMAFAFTKLLATLLFGVRAVDVPSFGLVLAVLVIVAIAGSLLPALEATRLDPAESLRTL
jgi:putative ABC transport system permease protein